MSKIAGYKLLSIHSGLSSDKVSIRKKVGFYRNKIEELLQIVYGVQFGEIR